MRVMSSIYVLVDAALQSRNMVGYLLKDPCFSNEHQKFGVSSVLELVVLLYDRMICGSTKSPSS